MVATDSMIFISIFVKIGQLAQNMKDEIYTD
jgi:hypothetical protein